MKREKRREMVDEERGIESERKWEGRESGDEERNE